MIQPNEYITEYYALNFHELQKPPTNRFPNINFSKLPIDRKKLNVDVNIKINENLIIKNKVEWDLADVTKSPYKFAQILMTNLPELEESIKEENLKSIPNQIRDQIVFHVDENTYFSRVRLVKNDNEPSLGLLCGNCGTLKYNSDYCVNCMFVYEKKNIEKKIISIGNPNLTLGKEMFLGENVVLPPSDAINKFETKPTERQRLLELKSKDQNPIESFTLAYNEAKEKKVCKKCGELNGMIAIQCRKCTNKFPVCDYFDLKLQENYAINFWDKINKHNTIQQLKNFQTKFFPEDFTSIKYLYFKILNLLQAEYQDILTDEAYNEIIGYLQRMYRLYTKPSITVEKVFESAFLTKFGKPRPKISPLNFNDLKDCVEGYLPEDYIEEVHEEDNIKNEKPDKEKIKVLGRKRGRPKKQEIFKANELEEEEVGVKMEDREKLYDNSLCPAPYKHFDFCGKCYKSGKLLSCESCSSSYHYECLKYDKAPKGKFKCYFCKIIKFGIDKSTFVDKDQIRLIGKLQKPIKVPVKNEAWLMRANQLMDILYAHPCSVFMREMVPESLKDYFEEFSENIYLDLIKKKLNSKEYSQAQDMINELQKVFNNQMSYFDSGSFMYRQAHILNTFVKFLIKEEKIFGDFIKLSGVQQDDDVVSESSDNNIEKQSIEENAIDDSQKQTKDINIKITVTDDEEESQKKNYIGKRTRSKYQNKYTVQDLNSESEE